MSAIVLELKIGEAYGTIAIGKNVYGHKDINNHDKTEVNKFLK